MKSSGQELGSADSQCMRTTKEIAEEPRERSQAGMVAVVRRRRSGRRWSCRTIKILPEQTRAMRRRDWWSNGWMLRRPRTPNDLHANARPRPSLCLVDCFQALLSRYSGQSDILFLTPHANRTGNTETIMGPLADPICLTGRVAAAVTFRELVTRFGAESMDAMEQALPLNL